MSVQNNMKDKKEELITLKQKLSECSDSNCIITIEKQITDVANSLIRDLTNTLEEQQLKAKIAQDKLKQKWEVK